MNGKRNGRKAKSGGGAKAGKRTAKKGNLTDLEAKGGQKIRGGFTITKTTDSSTPKLFPGS